MPALPPHSPTRLPPIRAMPRETSRPSSWKRDCLREVRCPEATRGKTSAILREQDCPREPAQSWQTTTLARLPLGREPGREAGSWPSLVLTLCLTPPPVPLTLLHRHLGLPERPLGHQGGHRARRASRAGCVSRRCPGFSAWQPGWAGQERERGPCALGREAFRPC